MLFRGIKIMLTTPMNHHSIDLRAPTISFDVWLDCHITHFELQFTEYLHRLPDGDDRLAQAMRYVSLDGGKRLRPLLVYAVGELLAVPLPILDRIAMAVECIHVYSLVHDDMPCMDNDDLRRGRPTCHKAYDEAMALLVGDTLQSLAFELMSEPMPHVEANRQLMMVACLAKASGIHGMARGQAIDLSAVGQSLTETDLRDMHAKKTGALIEAAVLLGAMPSPKYTASLHQSLSDFSQGLGLLFQVMDDILDAVSDDQTLGKTAGKDAANHKPTYVSLKGLAGAKAYAETLLETVLHHEAAIYAAQRLSQTSPHILPERRLQSLTHFVFKRIR
jgi:farnesyl diphosphate synthase